MSMTMPRKGEKGFTLIELLIVVAIIGILAAIAIPQFGKYKRNASLKAATASIKQCVTEMAAAYAAGDNADQRAEQLIFDSAGDNWAKNCVIADTSVPITFDPEAGRIVANDYNDITVSAVTMTCSISDPGVVECN